MATDPDQILQSIRAYLLEGFSSVTIAHIADAKAGSKLIHVLDGRKRAAVEVTDAFMDPNPGGLSAVDALRKWDLIGTLKSAESGSIVRVTTAGLRIV